MKNILSAKGKILASALGLFGISACSSPSVEYGSPYAEFHIHGTVTDEQSLPLGGIAVEAAFATDTTGTDGHYSIKTSGFGRPDAPSELHLKDIDPERDHPYPDTVVDISFDNIHPEGGDGHWNKGTYTLQRNIQMKKI